jgi:hypothetical protein
MPATLMPTTQELTALAQSLARNMCHEEGDVDDLIQEALRNCYRDFKQVPRPHKPFAFARTTMWRGMFDYYNNNKQRQRAREQSLEAQGMEFPAPRDEEQELLDRLEIEQYLTALEKTHGLLARRVAENLLAPTDPAFCQFILDEVAAKERANHKSSGRVRISKRQLREAFELRPDEWQQIMTTIRTFTRTWLKVKYMTEYGEGDD